MGDLICDTLELAYCAKVLSFSLNSKEQVREQIARSQDGAAFDRIILQRDLMFKENRRRALRLRSRVFSSTSIRFAFLFLSTAPGGGASVVWVGMRGEATVELTTINT